MKKTESSHNQICIYDVQLNMKNFCSAKKVKYTTWGAKTTPKSCFFLDVISTKRSRV